MMKHALLLLALAFTLSACFAAADPAMSANSAAAQQARAEAALQQAQQLQADAQAAAAEETAQAQAAQKVRESNATATAQAVSAAYTQMAMTVNAVNLPSTEAAILAQQTVQAQAVKATVDARAMLALQEQAQTTATSQAAAARQTAQALEAKATVDARALLIAQQQTAATATAEAVQRDSAIADQAASTLQQQRELDAWLIPLLAVIAFGLVLILGAKFISGLIDRANDARRLKNQRMAQMAWLPAAPAETIIFVGDPPTAFGKMRALNTPINTGSDDNGNTWTSSASQIIDADKPPLFVILSNGEPVSPDRAKAREEAARCKIAMKLLREAIDHEGPHSNRIPSAAQLGWPHGAWAITVASLKPYGVEILHEQDRETYLLGRWANLQALYIAVGERYLACLQPAIGSVNTGPIISPRGMAANTSS